MTLGERETNKKGLLIDLSEKGKDNANLGKYLGVLEKGETKRGTGTALKSLIIRRWFCLSQTKYLT